MSEYDITTGYLFRQFPEDFVKFTAGDTAEDIELADPVLKQVRHADANHERKHYCLRYYSLRR